MGCLCSGGTAKPNLSVADKVGTKPVLGRDTSREVHPDGHTQEEQRRLNLEAAEKRLAQSRGRGVANVKKVQESEEAAVKAQYVGKITTHYQMRHEDVPLGLKLLSLEKLKDHYQELVLANRKEGIINRSKQ